MTSRMGDSGGQVSIGLLVLLETCANLCKNNLLALLSRINNCGLIPLDRWHHQVGLRWKLCTDPNAELDPKNSSQSEWQRSRSLVTK